MSKRNLYPDSQLPYMPFPKTVICLRMQTPVSHQFPFLLLPFTIALFLLYKKESILVAHPKYCYGALLPGCKSLQNLCKEVIQECTDPGVNPLRTKQEK